MFVSILKNADLFAFVLLNLLLLSEKNSVQFVEKTSRGITRIFVKNLGSLARTKRIFYCQPVDSPPLLSCFFSALFIFTFLFYASAIAAVVLLYVYYTKPDSCTESKVLISLNLIFCIVVSVMSVLPKIQVRFCALCMPLASRFFWKPWTLHGSVSKRGTKNTISRVGPLPWDERQPFFCLSCHLLTIQRWESQFLLSPLPFTAQKLGLLEQDLSSQKQHWCASVPCCSKLVLSVWEGKSWRPLVFQ